MINFLLRLLKPLQILIQRIGYIESDLTKQDIDNMLGLIKAGDVLGSYESGRFTSWFIRGEFDHLAIVDQSLRVVEAVGDRFKGGRNLGGVRRVLLEEWLWKKNHIFIARHNRPDVGFRVSFEAAEIAEQDEKEDIGYDYAFLLHNSSYYCSELVKKCFTAVLPAFMKNKETVLPIDFFNHKDFTIVYNTREKR